MLQLHRGLVQPSAPAFGTGLSIPHGIRSRTGGDPGRHVVRKPENRPLKRGYLKITRRTDVVGIFPNEDAITWLVCAILLEQSDEWAIQRARYMTLETIDALSDIATGSPPTLAD